MGIQDWYIITAIIAGVISVGVAVYLFFWVLRQQAGSEKHNGWLGGLRKAHSPT